jgi:hypothetical protein
MIGNRMRAFALSTALIIVCFAPPAIAAQFDGNCCDDQRPLRKNRDRSWRKPRPNFLDRWILRASPDPVAGRISALGQVKMNAVAGPRIANGTGRFGRLRDSKALAGTGTWAGTGPSGVCSGVWNATRS